MRAAQCEADHACRHAARALDAGAASATMDAAMAKRFATDACFGIASDAMQVTQCARIIPAHASCACPQLHAAKARPQQSVHAWMP